MTVDGAAETFVVPGELPQGRNRTSISLSHGASERVEARIVPVLARSSCLSRPWCRALYPKSSCLYPGLHRRRGTAIVRGRYCPRRDHPTLQLSCGCRGSRPAARARHGWSTVPRAYRGAPRRRNRGWQCAEDRVDWHRSPGRDVGGPARITTSRVQSVTIENVPPLRSSRLPF